MTVKEVIPGLILYLEGEGFVRLIEAAGQELPEMENDRSIVSAHRRWLVEFLAVEECETLTKEQYFNQTNQKSRKTHRSIKYDVGKFADVHARYSNIGEQYLDTRDLIIDDYSMFF